MVKPPRYQIGNIIMTGGFSNLEALLVVRHSVIQKNQNVFLEEKNIVQTKQKYQQQQKGFCYSTFSYQ